MYFPLFFQLQHEERVANLRAGQRDPHADGTSVGSRALAAPQPEIPHGRAERREPASGERSRGQVDHLRGEEHVGRHHLRRDIARHRDLHPELWPDTQQPRLGGGLLHSRHAAVDLVRRVLLVLRRQSRNAEVHQREGEGEDRDQLRAPRARVREDGRPVEVYIHVGAVLGADLHQHFRQLLLVLSTDAAAFVHEQDSEVRHHVGKGDLHLIGNLEAPRRV